MLTQNYSHNDYSQFLMSHCSLEKNRKKYIWFKVLIIDVQQNFFLVRITYKLYINDYYSYITVIKYQ